MNTDIENQIILFSVSWRAWIIFKEKCFLLLFLLYISISLFHHFLPFYHSRIIWSSELKCFKNDVVYHHIRSRAGGTRGQEGQECQYSSRFRSKPDSVKYMIFSLCVECKIPFQNTVLPQIFRHSTNSDKWAMMYITRRNYYGIMRSSLGKILQEILTNCNYVSF